MQVSYNEFMDEGKGQFGCLANINTGPQVIIMRRHIELGIIVFSNICSPLPVWTMH